MALTKVGKEGVVGLDNSADATAVTIDSAENVAIGVTSKNSSNNGSLTIGHTGMTKVSASASGNADELVLIGADASANVGMSIIANNANQSNIFFGDEDDTDIGGITYNHSDNSMSLITNTATGLKIDSTGAVTMPLQPAFYAVVNSSQDNIATGQWHAIIFGLERFDSNADFNNSNGTFTAPVTGKYQLNTSIRLSAADTAANAYLFRLYGSYRAPIANYDGNQYATDTEITVQLSALLDMDANDTVTVEVYQDGGTAQTDIQNGEYSFFNGILVG